MKTLRTAVLGLALVVPQIAGAAKYGIDPAHSSVVFGVRHFVSQTRGSFQKFEGSIDLDEKDLSKSSVSVAIDVASITTANEKRDGHLRGEDFFWVEKFPKAEFVSTKVSKAGKNKFKVEGNLTLRGVTKALTLDVVKLGETKTPWGTSVCGFSAKAKINRLDWDLKWNKALGAGEFMLGDEVSLEIEVEASVKN